MKCGNSEGRYVAGWQPLRVNTEVATVCYKLIISGSKAAHCGVIAHMISWKPTLFPMVQTWKWQHIDSCGAKLIESFCLIEFHCSYCSVAASAQVALTAAARQRLGRCIFCGLNACIHRAGAGISPNILQCYRPVVLHISCNHV